MSSGGKRRSSMNGSLERSKRRRRGRPDAAAAPPPPPPPPPEPLIRLLQSDTSVLEYFQALQASLDADVKRWKNRAELYKEKGEQLQKQLSEASSHSQKEDKSPVTTKKLRAHRKRRMKSYGLTSSASKDDLDNQESRRDTSVPLNIEGECIPIDDSMFDFSDEESTNVSVSEFANNKHASGPPEIDVDETYRLLYEAQSCLEKLGVRLVTQEVEQDESDQQARNRVDLESNGVNSTPVDVEETIEVGHVENANRSLIRRSDHHVVADLMHALHMLTQIHVSIKESKAYHPFLSPRMIPCCYGADEERKLEQTHPAREGLTCAFRALTIMHAYCESCSEYLWDSIFAEKCGEIDDEVRTGMYNRRDLVETMIESLHGEISGSWAAADRSTRLTTTSLHYDGSQTIEAFAQNISSVTDAPEFGPKSQSRLASLSERCIHALLASNLYHHWGQSEDAANLVWEYVLATTPSLDVEEYPRLPPVLSLCVLEALLCRDDELLQRRGSDEMNSTRKLTFICQLLNNMSNPKKGERLSIRSLVLSINTTAQIWKERLCSEDNRISDISRVELAGHSRLVSTKESSWLDPLNEITTLEGCREVASSIINDSLGRLLAADNNMEDETVLRDCDTTAVRGGEIMDAKLGLQLALVIVGDNDVVENALNRACNALQGRESPGPAEQGLRSVVLLCCVAFRQMHIRQVDGFRLKQGLSQLDRSSLPLFKAEDLVGIAIERHRDGEIDWNLISTIAQCCVQLANGEALFRLLRWLICRTHTEFQHQTDNADREKRNAATLKIGETRHKVIGVISSLMNTGQVPTVRVINLRRRHDRMSSFVAQAQREQINVVRAIAQLDINEEVSDVPRSLNSVDSGYNWGHYAFDGQGRAAEVEATLSSYVGVGQRLSAFVSTHWRPNDLKAFDKDAREDDATVMMTGSERACALSHIASWKGIARSLSTSGHQIIEKKIFPHAENTLRLFRITGFARGAPLLHHNSSMPPKPVCVVLEDDAILVDRFVERLMSVLEELPRDFHFCSLGYSRPSTAPIAKYSSQLGIPSCLWYLTGYVLSLDGANMLLDSLPVVGPVDSWIGLKMCSNWDNVFGHHIGVGVHSRPLAELPPRKDLVKILKFRAFCVLSPLCSQKVGTTAALPTAAGRTWRQRDTDIVYSGES